MAVQSDTSSITYTGNNSTTTSYTVPFVFLENSHLAAIAKVTATGVETAVTLVDHIGAGNPSGGNVRTAVAVPATSTLTIFRTVPATQTTTYQEGGDFPAASHERALDKLTMLSQQIDRSIKNSLRTTEAVTPRNPIVVVPNSMLGIDESGQPKAMTLSEVKAYLSLTGVTLTAENGIKTFADDGERNLAEPDFIGQIASQRNTNNVYISNGLEAGDWLLLTPSILLSAFSGEFFTANSVGRGKFQEQFVDSSLIADAAITSGKLAIGSVTSAALAAGSVGTTALANDAVTQGKLATISGLTAGSYGASAQVPIVTVDNKGRVTSISTTPVFQPTGIKVASFPTILRGESGADYYSGNVVFRDSNGLLRVAGSTNTAGQLGTGSEKLATNDAGYLVAHCPLQAGETVSKIYCNATHLFVLSNLGNLYGCGANTVGALGLGDTTERTVLTKLTGISNVVDFSISTGNTTNHHCLAITSSGELYGWGYNATGQLGLNNTTNQNSPQLINGGSLSGKTISKCYAFTGSGFSYVIDSNNDIHSCGYNGFGQLGLGDTTNRSVFVQITGLKADKIFGVGQASATFFRGSAYLLRNGQLYGTGSNSVGELGVGDTVDKSSFVLISGLSDVVDVAVSNNGNNAGSSVAALLSNGSLRTWGNNAGGQLGIGNTINQNAPQTPTGISGLTFTKIQMNGRPTTDGVNLFALANNGKLFSCGYRGRTFGTGIGVATDVTTLTAASVPNDISFSDFCVFGSGTTAVVLAATNDGNLWAWGANGAFQCGCGGGAQVNIPQKAFIL